MERAGNTAERAQETEQRLRLLAETVHQLLCNDNPRQLLPRLLERLSANLGVEYYVNYLVDDAGRLRLDSFAGIPSAGLEALRDLAVGEETPGMVALERRPLDLVRSAGLAGAAARRRPSPRAQGRRLLSAVGSRASSSECWASAAASARCFSRMSCR